MCNLANAVNSKNANSAGSKNPAEAVRLLKPDGRQSSGGGLSSGTRHDRASAAKSAKAHQPDLAEDLRPLLP